MSGILQAIGRQPDVLLAAYTLLYLAALAWLAWPAARRADGVWHLLGAACLLAIATHRLRDPWWFQHDFNGALAALGARNVVRLGLAYTHGLDLWNGGAAEPLVPRFYAHHPPLSTWLLVPSVWLLGAREWVIRLASLLPMLAAWGLLFRTLKQRGVVTGPLGWVLLAAMPAVAFYSRSVGYEPTGMTGCILLTALALHPAPGRWAKPAAFILGAFLVLAGWSGMLFAAFAILVFALGRRWSLALPLAAGSLAGGLLLLTLLGRHYHWDVQPLLDQFGRRSAGSASEAGPISSTASWIKQVVGRHLWTLIGLAPIVLALAGLRFVGRSGWARTVVWLLASATALLLILRQWSFVHEYAVCHLALPILLLGLLALLRLSSGPRRRLRLAAAALLLGVGLWSGLAETSLRYRRLVGFEHDRRMGVLAGRLTGPEDVLLLEDEIPSPVFLYYADRDFIIWPHPLLDAGYRPRAYIQMARPPAKDTPLHAFLESYERDPTARRIWLRK